MKHYLSLLLMLSLLSACGNAPLLEDPPTPPAPNPELTEAEEEKQSAEAGEYPILVVTSVEDEENPFSASYPTIPPSVDSDPFIDEIADFDPGLGASFNHDLLPNIVLGEPGGSLDTVSLGAHGRMTLCSETPILDGPGVDFTVFENAFLIAGNPDNPFHELAEIGVSQNGVHFSTFPCQDHNEAELYPGCAGKTPTNLAANPLDPANSGGDAFDLADLDLDWALCIQIQDLNSQAELNEDFPHQGGFDLDAIAIIHQ